MNEMQSILGHLRRADNDFNLIADGDKIAIGLSGGKDSLTLLSALVNYQKFGIKKFELIAISIDNTDGQTDFTKITKFCENLGVEHHIEPSQIFKIIFGIRKEKSPCSLCAKMRRGILCSSAQKYGANKIALGHHCDDMLETFFLSLLYEGRLSTMKAKTYMSRTNITVIRPLIYCPERETIAISKHQKYPIINNCCILNGKTERAHMKNLIKYLEREIPDSRPRIEKALESSRLLIDNQ